MKKILLVEDDIPLQKTLQTALQKEGYEVICLDHLQHVLSIFNATFQLVILDIELPDGSGIALCKELRKHSEVPILFLTANSQEETLVQGLEAGGDDYMTKPFSIIELYARIKALLRRRQTKYLKIGDIELDLEQYLVIKNGQELSFTAIEYAILFAFVLHPSQVLTRHLLLEIIEEKTKNIVEDNTLSVYVKRVRDKLGTYHGKPYIETIRGVGYRLYEDK